MESVAFAAAMRELLTKGRSKFWIILIVVPTNCGKTFLLSPLQKIFNTFCNSANDKQVWLGAEKAEITFSNDFRWSHDMIAWNKLLILLEGQAVHLPSSKNHYPNDIYIDKNTSIVATSKGEITYVGKYDSLDTIENEMMSIRWKTFKFYRRIVQPDQVDLSPCPKYFVKLVMEGTE